MVNRKIRKRGKERHKFFFHSSRESVCSIYIEKFEIHMKLCRTTIPMKESQDTKVDYSHQDTAGTKFWCWCQGDSFQNHPRGLWGHTLPGTVNMQNCSPRRSSGKQGKREMKKYRSHTAWNVLNRVPNWMLIFTAYMVSFIFPCTPKCLGRIKTEKVFMTEWNTYLMITALGHLE